MDYINSCMSRIWADPKLSLKFQRGVKVNGVNPEDMLKKSIKEYIRESTKVMTHNEQLRISFVPMVIAHTAWTYTLEAIDYATDNKMRQYAGVSRKLKECRRILDADITNGITREQASVLTEIETTYLDKFRNDMLLFYFSVKQNILSLCPDDEHLDMHTASVMAYLLYGEVFTFIRRMDKFIEQKLGCSAYSEPNHQLKTMQDEVAKFFDKTKTMKLSDNVKNCIKIFEKNVDGIVFE